MIPFITYKEGDDYYILQKQFPHFLGKIYTGWGIEGVLKVNIPNYEMGIKIIGTLRGEVLPSYINIIQEAETVLMEMADWYLANRISINPKKYEKWKSKQH